ncbi:MAG: phosphomannomutase/phosphoglucomutase [Gammaproteobacteria bacterium]|nr:phosphomannomutase/phosphoglucomutase [Gammaproteobacteria bacterium]
MTLDKEIFRAYDIRGIVDSQLNDQTIYQLGQALGTEALIQGSDSLITARDGRLSSPALMPVLQVGILSTGCNVIDIGMVPTPILYFGTHYLPCNSGVMLTGSHNPANYNGIKPIIDGKNLDADAILALYDRIQEGDFYCGNGRLQTVDISEAYLEKITAHIVLKRPIKVVIDCANGATGHIAPQLFERLGCELISLYTDIDGHFPHHHPDPSVPANMHDLIAAVKTHQADIGFAFDGDGDRLGMVTNEGEIIWPDRQLALFAKDILPRHPGSTIVYDVKCSNLVKNTILEQGGRPLMYKTGHTLIKNKMMETDSPLSGEMSGHIYFKERWFGFDDGLYTGARFLEILTHQSKSSADLFREISAGVNTPELKLSMPENRKFSFIDALFKEARFEDAEMTTIDGLRIDLKESWGLVRASNTTPHLIFRFEGDDEAALIDIQHRFRAWMLQVDNTLELPF